MSYNIDSVKIVHAKGFTLSLAEREVLRKRFVETSPESSIFDADWPTWGSLGNLPVAKRNRVDDVEGVVHVRQFWWHGEGSGSSLDVLARVLAAFDGEADLVLTWAGGDSFSGLRLREHVVTRYEVVLTLGKEQA